MCNVIFSINIEVCGQFFIEYVIFTRFKFEIIVAKDKSCDVTSNCVTCKMFMLVFSFVSIFNTIFVCFTCINKTFSR